MYEIVKFNGKLYVGKDMFNLMEKDGCYDMQVVGSFTNWKEAFDNYKILAGWNV